MPDINSRNLLVQMEKKKDEIVELLEEDLGGGGDAVMALATTINIEDVAAGINTVGKVRGKLVLNINTGVVSYADGALATDEWKLVSTGATTHTPS